MPQTPMEEALLSDQARRPSPAAGGTPRRRRRRAPLGSTPPPPTATARPDALRGQLTRGPRTCPRRPVPPPRRRRAAGRGSPPPPPARRGAEPAAARPRRRPRTCVPGKALGTTRRPGGAYPPLLHLLPPPRQSSLRPAAPGPPADVPPARSRDVPVADGRPVARCTARRRTGGRARGQRLSRRGALPQAAAPGSERGAAAAAPRQVRLWDAGRALWKEGRPGTTCAWCEVASRCCKRSAPLREGLALRGEVKAGGRASQSQLLSPERTEKLRGEVLRNAVDAEHLPLFPFLKRGFSV